ncbi:MAG: N,N-dimethylformamidase beta subunit family domain-containing protein, partial [Solirubrobacteraceae bacterium]
MHLPTEASHTVSPASRRRCLSLALLLVLAVFSMARVAPARADSEFPCPTTGNPIPCENSLAGFPASDWDPGAPDNTSIEGYATSMGVDVGQTENFKIDTASTSYTIDILRLGWYGGDGARLITTIKPSVSLPQSQPACLVQSGTGLIDCGNWAVSASWAVPTDAVSGVYVAHLVDNTSGAESNIQFVVRNDAGTSDVLVATSDATWEAYNSYGGNSLYICSIDCPPGNPGGYHGAAEVSYNRPFYISGTDLQGDDEPFGADERGIFWAEYPMIQFLEREGYNVSYINEAEIDADPSLLLNHKIFISSGHDEYWSAGQRAAVQSAINAGVNVAFFSGNEMFWKTRWAASIDGSNTPYRTLVSYKETHYNAVVDPDDPPTWTGTWRDPRFSPPADGDNPENAITGQLGMVDDGTADITVPYQYSRLRLWRNTQVASLTPGQTLTLAPGAGTLGFEWDMDADNGFRPAGEFDLSSTTVNGVNAFYDDYGTSEAINTTGVHNLTEYRAPSGALVFGAGTVDWAWGLDSFNGNGTSPDPNMEQATVNLLADMGNVQPATLEAGLVAATESTNRTPPTSTITTPTAGSSVSDGSRVTVTGTATDSAGGVVAGVEVSTNGGSSWNPATLTSPDNTAVTWSYTWIAHGYPSTTIESRAVDDSGNIETPSDGETVTVNCPCSLWGPNVSPTTIQPGSVDSGDGTSVEVGVKFTSDIPALITGVRFYKATTNTGTHVGNLWTASGQLLATATFTNETASGWQQVNFSTPVQVAADTTYIASYFAPSGHYSTSPGYFYGPPSPGLGGASVDAPPLHAIHGSAVQDNGLYLYTTTSAFPVDTSNGTNYWVDPVLMPLLVPGQVTGVTATAQYDGASVSWSAPSTGGPVGNYTITPYIGSAAQTPTTAPASSTTAVISGLSQGTSYTFVVQASNAAGSGPASARSNAVTPTGPTAPLAPQGVSGSPASGQALVSWSAPASNGG